MNTIDIHAELIAAFLGDDEPSYGQCQCAPCRASRPNPYRGTGLRGRGATSGPATHNGIPAQWSHEGSR